MAYKLAVFLVAYFIWGSYASPVEDSVREQVKSSTEKLDDLFERIANNMAGDEECISMELPGNCYITDDCLKVSCFRLIGGKKTFFTFKLNRCNDPISVTVDIRMNKLQWARECTSGDQMAVPGLKIKGSGLFVEVLIEPEDNMITLQVTLAVGSKLGSASDFPLKIQLVNKHLPISTDYCGFIRWWKFGRSNAERIVLIAAAVSLVVAIVSGGCGCCWPCKKVIAIVRS